MSKRPAKVSVMGVPFTVEYLDKVITDGEEVAGLTTGSEYSIKISLSENDTAAKLEASLMHEICHAVLHVAGLTNLLNDDLEEAVVTAIEHGFSGLYRRK